MLFLGMEIRYIGRMDSWELEAKGLRHSTCAPRERFEYHAYRSSQCSAWLCIVLEPFEPETVRSGRQTSTIQANGKPLQCSLNHLRSFK